MKRCIFFLVLAIAICPLFADWAFDVGFYVPKGAKTGVNFGVENIFTVDKSVDLFISGDFFIRSFTDTKDIGEYKTDAGNPVTERMRTADISTKYIPILLGARFTIPNVPANPFLGGGIGWGIAWESVYRAQQEGIQDGEHYTIPKVDTTKFYNGFNWQVQGGVSFPLGYMSKLYIQTYYNGAKLTKDTQKSAHGITWTELDMSGFGMSAGLKVRF